VPSLNMTGFTFLSFLFKCLFIFQWGFVLVLYLGLYFNQSKPPLSLFLTPFPLLHIVQ
jgi:hypothetical protein